MVQSLTFIDCAACGKRIRSNALKCHHCHQDHLPGNVLSHPRDSDSPVRPDMRKKTTSTTGEHNSESHMASDSGYDDDADDFDYEEYLAEEFPGHAPRRSQPRVKRWVWVTAWVLIFATLLPYLYYVAVIAS